ncbi:MAG: magnetosome biogenesis CDF transporter MamB [SAR324 cluster bacterium]|nr:magnetosome biogenesis CDF transporter MamB [SAR324 cluster bacterium]
MRYDQCYNCRMEATWYSFFVNVFQASLKGFLGVLSGSSALIADGLHSSADVIASMVTMVSVKISSKLPSDNYAYGYGKIQFISSSIVGTILILGALYLFVGSASSIINNEIHTPSKIALLGALVSVIMNELLYRFQSCVGKENNSPAIMSNAWDNRSDAISSSAVFFGVICATFGFPIADPIAAIAVSLIIIKIGTELNIEAVNGLMDHSPDITDLHDIYFIAQLVEGVLGISSLKSRRQGEVTLIDIEIEVDPALKVYEGDLIALAVKIKISEEIEGSEVQVFLRPGI